MKKLLSIFFSVSLLLQIVYCFLLRNSELETFKQENNASLEGINSEVAEYMITDSTCQMLPQNELWKIETMFSEA